MDHPPPPHLDSCLICLRTTPLPLLSHPQITLTLPPPPSDFLCGHTQKSPLLYFSLVHTKCSLPSCVCHITEHKPFECDHQPSAVTQLTHGAKTTTMVLCGTSPTRTLVLRLRVFTEDNVYAAQPDHRPQICLTSSHIIQIKEGGHQGSNKDLYCKAGA